jgi:(4-(4-[2-(gamma-L-glutamylamino)ethyl]phenoxymethyl)furan-2-yl)methanamine synthase
MSWLALDVGGANLKAADGRGYAAVRPFALWREPRQLAGELRALIAGAPPCERLAVTMTGELCDCFETKADGVREIVAAVASAAAGPTVSVYAVDGQFLTPEEAVRSPLAVAASNWHALAAFAVRFAGGRPALLVDIGSTTADLIPLSSQAPVAVGRTDPERLAWGELVYTGVERTPVAAVTMRLPWREADCPVASELFATTADAYVMLGELPEDAANIDTADNRPRTREAARARLARMICADSTMFSHDDALHAAAAVREAQIRLLAAAAERVLARMAEAPANVILSGHGEFLARAFLARTFSGEAAPELISLTQALGPHVSRCAPAHALAVLAEERHRSAPAP